MFLQAFYVMKKLPSENLMSEIYRNMIRGLSILPQPVHKLSNQSDIYTSTKSSERQEAVCRASILWLVAELGEMAHTRGLPPSSWADPDFEWLELTLARLSLLGLDLLDDLPTRARPVLLIVMQQQRRASSHTLGQQQPDFVIPPFINSFMADFYTSLDRYFDRQEQYEWFPARDHLKYNRGQEKYTQASRQDKGINRISLGPSLNDSWIDPGDTVYEEPKLKLRTAGALNKDGIRRRPINQLQDLCQGLEFLQLAVHVPESCRPKTQLLNRWLSDCFFALDNFFLHQIRTDQRAMDQTHGTSFRSSWPTTYLNEGLFVPPFFVDILPTIVRAGLRPPDDEWMTRFGRASMLALPFMKRADRLADLAWALNKINVRFWPSGS